EAVHADVARILARPHVRAAEVPEDRRALVLRVLPSQPSLRRKEGVAAARVDDVARLDPVAPPLVGAHFEAAVTRAALLDADRLVALARVGAALARVRVQHPVEVLSDRKSTRLNSSH